MERLQSFVGGRWVDGGGTPVVLTNPATEEPVAEVRNGFDAQGALTHARAAGTALRKLTFAERGALLQEMSRVLHADRERLLDISTAINGATRGDSKFDVDGATGTLAAYATLGKELGDRRFLVDGDPIQLGRAPRFVGQHVRMPLRGVAVHINAFNFPAWGTFEKAAVALLAGMPILTKPATATALLAWHMVKVVLDAKILPEGTLSFVAGSLGDLFDHLGPQDVVAFTGSADTAARLRATPSILPRSVRFNAEADSLNAAVLGPDVEEGSDLWHWFVRAVTTDVTQKTGQKCTAIRRVIVPDARADAFVEALSDTLGRVVVGNPLDASVTMGPVATRQQLADVRDGIAWLREETTLVAGGADPIDGVGAPAGKGYFVRPTLLRTTMDRSSRVHEREVFGPSVAVVSSPDDADAMASGVARAQGSLVSTVASDDPDWLGAFLEGASAWNGRVLVSSTKVADQATPPGMVLPSLVHGGPGRAGGGVELGGTRGLELYTQRTALQGDRGLLGRILGTERA